MPSSLAAMGMEISGGSDLSAANAFTSYPSCRADLWSFDACSPGDLADAGRLALALLHPFAPVRVVRTGCSLLLIRPLLSRSLIADCRTVVEWWVAGDELGGGVFGFPSLSFGDGLEEEAGGGWDGGVGGCGSFPPVGAV